MRSPAFVSFLTWCGGSHVRNRSASTASMLVSCACSSASSRSQTSHAACPAWNAQSADCHCACHFFPSFAVSGPAECVGATNRSSATRSSNAATRSVGVAPQRATTAKASITCVLGRMPCSSCLPVVSSLARGSLAHGCRSWRIALISRRVSSNARCASGPGVLVRTGTTTGGGAACASSAVPSTKAASNFMRLILSAHPPRLKARDGYPSGRRTFGVR